MSGWLQSVNSLLHQLDDTVENVAENVAEERAGIGQGKNAVDSILTKRGLSSNIDDDEDDGVDPMLDIQSPDKAVTTEMKAEQHPFIEESWDDVDDVDFEQVITSELLPEPPLLPVETQVEAVAETTAEKVDSVEVIEPSDQRAQTEDEKLNQTDEQKVNQTDDVKPLEEPELVVNAGQIKNEPEAQKEATPADNQLERNDAVEPKEADSEPQSQPSSGTDQPQTSKAEDVSPRLTKMILPPTSRLRIAASNQGSPARNKRPPPQPKPVKTFEKEYKECVQHMKEAQREARQLRRHVVSLNSELETAESEIGPLKQELERAGQRLDKDRKRHKEEMDTVKTRYADELAVLRKQHEGTLKEMQARNSGQLEDMRKQLREAEEKRTQEGGDWTKEFQQTVQKEQELHRKISLLEDEKSTSLAQISTLQSQLNRVQNRMDSISQTADNAMHREREAEDKLDQALSLHARQISQRQTREAELERAIADLSAAFSTAKRGGDGMGSGGDDTASESMKAQVSNLQEELETNKVQLEAEKQRVKMMQQELRDISKERSVETSSNRSKQLQFDRQIAEMSLQISRLQASLREAQKGPEEYVAHGDPGSSSNQIKELTREVVRLQEKLGQSGSEVSALRNRLVVAAERAEKAEQALVEEGDIENSPSSGNSIPFGRGGGGVVSSMRRRNKRGYGSIRSSLHLDNVQDVNAKRLVKAIDIADRISVDTGKFLRYNPLARGGFILYLGMLHLWTFTVLFFHAHRFETVHGDFGAKYPHGSHAMMHHIRPPEHHEIMKSAAAMNVDSVVEGTAGGGVQGVQAVDEKDPPVDGSEKESPKQAEKNDAKKEVEASENNEEEEVENVESDPEGEAPEMEENADHNVENSEEQA